PSPPASRRARPQCLRRAALRGRRGVVLPARSRPGLARGGLPGRAFLRGPSSDRRDALGVRTPPLLAAERPGAPILSAGGARDPDDPRGCPSRAPLGAGVLEIGDAARNPEPASRHVLPEPVPPEKVRVLGLRPSEQQPLRGLHEARLPP